MCLYCGTGPADLARRAHVLRLLSLIEHPDALAPDAALRLSREVMGLLDAAPAVLRCDRLSASPADPKPLVDRRH